MSGGGGAVHGELAGGAHDAGKGTGRGCCCAERNLATAARFGEDGRRCSRRGLMPKSCCLDASSPCDANGGSSEVNGGVSGLIEELDPGAAMAAAALGRARQWRCGHGSTTRSSGAVSWCRCGANGGAYGTGGGLWWEVGELGLGPAMVTWRPGARDGEREPEREIRRRGGRR